MRDAIDGVALSEVNSNVWARYLLIWAACGIRDLVHSLVDKDL